MLSADVVYAGGGRLRLKTKDLNSNEALHKLLLDFLGSVSGVNVENHLSSKSLLVTYDVSNVDPKQLLELVKDSGEVSLNLLPENERKILLSDTSKLANELRIIAKDLDGRLGKATGGKVDLKTLGPLLVLLLAGRQIIFEGLHLRRIPWYVLAWYGFDSFIKLNKKPAKEAGNIRELNVNKQLEYSEMNAS